MSTEPQAVESFAQIQAINAGLLATNSALQSELAETKRTLAEVTANAAPLLSEIAQLKASAVSVEMRAAGAAFFKGSK
jgi:hypothetical protein